MSAILDVRNSLSITFLAISDRYATFFGIFLTKWLPAAILDVRNSFDRISGHFRLIGHFRFPKFTFDRNSGHSIFWPFHFFFRRPFWMSENHFGSHLRLIGHFECPKFTFDGINFWPFQINTQLFLGGIFLTKWPPAAILDGTTMSIIELVRDIWMSNACVKFEERSLNPSKVIVLPRLWRRRRLRY